MTEETKMEKYFHEEVKRRMDEAYDNMNKANIELKKHIVPIYIPDDNEKPFLTGSGVLLKIGTKHFIISSAHVFDGNSERPRYTFGGCNTFMELTGECHKTKHCDSSLDDKYDLVVLDLKDNFDENSILPHKFISLDNVQISDYPDRTKVYSIMGYPYSKNKKSFWGEPVKATILSNSCLGVEKELYANLKLSPDTHIIVKYDRSRLTTSDGKTQFGPDPKGMSGGALWYLKNIKSGYEPKQLVGIGIEYHKNINAILCTRIEFVLEMIRRIHPDLDALIPKSSKIQIIPDYKQDNA